MLSSQFIRKEDSKALYGIAILLMVFHHCFCNPSRLLYDYIPLLGSFETESRIAWIGRLCVPIYAFITGYAFSLKSRQDMEANLLFRLKNTIKSAVIQLFHFITKFWLVYFIVIALGCALSKIVFDPKNILKGMFNGGLEYCGEWWYIKQYIRFVLLYPVIDLLLFTFQKHKVICYIYSGAAVLGLIAAAVIIQGQMKEKLYSAVYNQIFVSYTLVFVIAFIIGYAGLFEKIDERFKIGTIVYIALACLCILYRWWYVKDSAQHDCDIYIAPVLIFALTGLLRSVNEKSSIRRFLKFCGRYSTYIWLIHPFFVYYYFQPIALIPRYSLLIFIWVFLVSLLFGILFDKVYLYLNSILKRCKKA